MSKRGAAPRGERKGPRKPDTDSGPRPAPPGAIAPDPDKLAARLEKQGADYQKGVYTYLGMCAFVLISVLLVNDSQLIFGSLGRDKIKLPLLQNDLPITPFFYLAPLVLLFFFLFLYLKEIRIYRDVARLCRLLPEGRGDPRFPDLPGLFKESDDWSKIRFRVLIFSALLPGLVLIEGGRLLSRQYPPDRQVLAALLFFSSWAGLHSCISFRRLISGRPQSGSWAWSVSAACVVSAGCYLVSPYLLGNGRLIPYPSIRAEQAPFSEPQKWKEALEQLAKGNIRVRSMDFMGMPLVGMELNSINLSRANLFNADFSQSLLNHAKFDSAKLDYAAWKGTTARASSFLKTRLEHAAITGSGFEKVGFDTACFHDARLIRDTLSDCTFKAASLLHASLDSTTITNARFDHADLEYASFRGGTVSASFFTYADLRQAHLRGTVLIACEFPHAKIAGASFDSCEIINCDFSAAENLRSDIFRGAYLDSKTLSTLPESIRTAIAVE